MTTTKGEKLAHPPTIKQGFEEKCECGFCKLRAIEMENVQNEILYLNKRKSEISESFRERSKELIELCVKEKLK